MKLILYELYGTGTNRQLIAALEWIWSFRDRTGLNWRMYNYGLQIMELQIMEFIKLNLCYINVSLLEEIECYPYVSL